MSKFKCLFYPSNFFFNFLFTHLHLLIIKKNKKIITSLSAPILLSSILQVTIASHNPNDRIGAISVVQYNGASWTRHEQRRNISIEQRRVQIDPETIKIMRKAVVDLIPGLIYADPSYLSVNIQWIKNNIEGILHEIHCISVIEIRTEIYGVCVCICEIKTGIESPSGLEGRLTAILFSIPSNTPKTQIHHYRHSQHLEKKLKRNQRRLWSGITNLNYCSM